MPASINNTDGFWENLRFVRLNERLLAASGGTWFAPPATPPANAEDHRGSESILAQLKDRSRGSGRIRATRSRFRFGKTLLPSMNVLVCLRQSGRDGVLPRLRARCFLAVGRSTGR